MRKQFAPDSSAAETKSARGQGVCEAPLKFSCPQMARWRGQQELAGMNTKESSVMKPRIERRCVPRSLARQGVAVICVVLVSAGGVLLAPPDCSGAVAAQDAARIPPGKLDSLVAPIALYPDPILAQTLSASTYPLELMKLQQWLQGNRNLKDKALADAAAKQPWDPSVQAMAGIPDLVKRLTDDIQWTTELGNAFLAQQSDVMDAIQRMRVKAQRTGALHTTQQVRVKTQVVERKSGVMIEQTKPDVTYVRSYYP